MEDCVGGSRDLLVNVFLVGVFNFQPEGHFTKQALE